MKNEDESEVLSQLPQSRTHDLKCRGGVQQLQMSEKGASEFMPCSPGSPNGYLEGCCDITMTRHFWKFLEDGHNRSERCPPVALIHCDWTDGGRSRNRSVNHTTRWKLHVKQTDESDVFQIIGGDTFTHLYHFANKLRKEHDTELLRIETETQLQLQGVEDRLQERMSCEVRNMENLVRTMIQKNLTYLEGELQNIAQAVHSQPHTANRHQTDDHDGTQVTTEGVSNVRKHVPETKTRAAPMGDSARSQDTCVDDEQDSPAPEPPDSSQDVQQTPSSEIISKNYREAQRLLATLTISRNGRERLTEATALALEDAHPSPPRATSAATVLCVDVSQSIGEEGLRELKEVVNRFIDGIETIAEEYGLEENIGVVAMGGDVTVMQDITNDYGRVRDAIDGLVLRGTSPIFEAIVVSVASIRNRAGALRIGRIHKVKPRIVFFTDGFATTADHPDGPDSVSSDSNVKIIRLTAVMAREQSDTDPLIWVPVGNADTTFLSSLAKLGNQELVEGKNIHSLCTRYRLQDAIAKIYICLERSFSKDRESKESNIEAVAEAFMSNMTHEERDLVIKAVRAKIEKKYNMLPDDSPSDFDNVFERKELPPLGSRVIRGPGWKYGDQDVGGPGTVVNHANDHQFLWVRWDLNDRTCKYRYGCKKQFDVVLVDQSRRLASNELIEIGVKVKRGTDWRYGNQDGGPGGLGMVIRKRKDGKVKVRWDNGLIKTYNFGSHGEFDLEISSEEDELSAVNAASMEEPASPSRVPVKDVKGNLQIKDRPHIVWQWRDHNGIWRLYTQKQIEKLEGDYNRKGARSCVLQKGDHSLRVQFKEPMSQKSSDDGGRCDVQRLAVSTGDLDQLISETSAVEDVGWTWADREYVQQ